MERESLRMVLDALFEDAERELEGALFPGGLGMLCNLAFRAERYVVG